MPSPSAIVFKSEKLLSTDEISLLAASLGGPDDPAIEKREFNNMGRDVVDDIAIGGRCEFILYQNLDCEKEIFVISS